MASNLGGGTLRGPVNRRLWRKKLPPPVAILRDSYGDKEIATMAGHVVEAKSIFDWVDDGPSGTTIYTYG